jgi:uncharacterized membrane protein YbhN (UPF0104 family)
LEKTKSKTKKFIKLFIQILITLAAIFLLLEKVSIEAISQTLQQSNLFYLLLAFIFFNLSKILSAVRLNRFFQDIELILEQGYNLKLYYLGMFYNLFLPGGIGGDGYKIYLLNKFYSIKILTLVKTLLIDRVSGLIALLFLAGILYGFSSFPSTIPYSFAFILLCTIAVYPIFQLIYKLKFPEFLASSKTTNLQALGVQSFQLASAFFIALSLDAHGQMIDLMTIFLISSIVAVLPFTVGGIGARELTFLYLLELIGQEPTIGVSLSILFFLITALSSLIGIVYMNSFQQEK